MERTPRPSVPHQSLPDSGGECCVFLSFVALLNARQVSSRRKFSVKNAGEKPFCIPSSLCTRHASCLGRVARWQMQLFGKLQSPRREIDTKTQHSPLFITGVTTFLRDSEKPETPLLIPEGRFSRQILSALHLVEQPGNLI